MSVIEPAATGGRHRGHRRRACVNGRETIARRPVRAEARAGAAVETTAIPTGSRRSPTSPTARCTPSSPASPAASRRRRSARPISIGRSISALRPASGCNSSTRRRERPPASRAGPPAARSTASRRTASSRCRRTGALPARTGITGRSTSSTKPSCSISNGGTTRPPEFAASPSSTSGWSNSCRGRSSTWSRRRISSRPIRRCYAPPSPRAG